MPSNPRPQIIFFGNGPLADAALEVLSERTDVIFHARTASDLTTVRELKLTHPTAFGILASFGVLIKPDLLDLFASTGGIINLHPSLLPGYRGPSPIESAILAGDNTFGYSIMQLSSAMDAGPLYHQATVPDLPLDKSAIYQGLATAGATWLIRHLDHLGTPTPQIGTPTYTTKLNKSLSLLQPASYTADEIYRQIIAYQGFPKPKYEFFGKTCIILEAHVLRITDILCEAAGLDDSPDNSPLMLSCADRNFVVITRLQPEGKKPMDAVSFINGYGKKH